MSLSSVALGLTLGSGLLLLASVVFWPRKKDDTKAGIGKGTQKKATALDVLAQNLSVSPGVFIGFSGIGFLLGGAIAWAATGVLGLALAAACGGAGLPAVLSRSRQRSREKALRGQWPDVIDGLLSSLRAGKTIPDAVSDLARSHNRHIAFGAREFADDFRVSANFSGSLSLLKARWANPAGDRIIETLRLMREVGSNDGVLVLQTLGTHLRADSAMRQEVEARQGWIRIAANIGLFAPWVVVAVLSTRSEAVAAYNSVAGLVLIVVGLAVSLVAYKIMLRVGRMPHERRWLA